MLSATRKNGNTSGQFAFLSPPGACMRSRSGLSSKSSQWCCSRSVVQKSRIARTGNPDRKLQWRCELSNQAEEEEALDERAMRAAEIHEVLQGLQDFKDRIINDATKLAKKVRANKKDLEKALENHPDIVKIDHHIKELNDELKQLGDR